MGGSSVDISGLAVLFLCSPSLVAILSNKHFRASQQRAAVLVRNTVDHVGCRD